MVLNEKMETTYLQITSGRGPAECCLAVSLALKELIKEAVSFGLEYEVVMRSTGVINGTLNSAIIKLSGKNCNAFSLSWAGVLLWISKSPYRKFHKRKNWFIGINEIQSSIMKDLNEKEMTFQTMRSSGPGGQNVNKTETAVRAIHVHSGLFATCDTHRSQLQNKHEAIKRLQEKFAIWQQAKLLEEGFIDPWENNNNLNRGNPKRIYTGEKFKKE